MSPIFSHGCPDFMSHPSMQFRIIKNSAVACPNPILTWCKISTRCCFLNAILQLSKHFQCIQQKFTTFSLSLCLSSRCSCCSRDMLLLRDSLRHSRWCCCSWCVRAYGLAVRRLLEGTLDYTTSSGRSSERCSELRFHYYYYGLSTPDFDYDRKVGKCFF